MKYLNLKKQITKTIKNHFVICTLNINKIQIT